MKSSPKSRTRRTYTPEYKAEAVRQVRASGRSIKEVAQDLGVSAGCLHAWVQQANIDDGQGAAGQLTSEERAELTRLRRELKVVQEERDFLKKAAAYFAKERP